MNWVEVFEFRLRSDQDLHVSHRSFRPSVTWPSTQSTWGFWEKCLLTSGSCCSSTQRTGGRTDSILLWKCAFRSMLYKLFQSSFSCKATLQKTVVSHCKPNQTPCSTFYSTVFYSVLFCPCVLFYCILFSVPLCSIVFYFFLFCLILLHFTLLCSSFLFFILLILWTGVCCVMV